MTEALRTLLSGLIDYAGLFPPAGLDMAEAAAQLRGVPRRPHAWALGRFIVPVGPPERSGPRLEGDASLGVPPRGGASRANQGGTRGRRRADPRDAAEGRDGVFRTAHRRGPRAARRMDAGAPRCAPADSRRRPSPSCADLARFLLSLRQVARAVQSYRRTASPDALDAALHLSARQPHAMMHGFVNVFLAAALLWHEGSAGDAIATLEEESPGEFHFDEQAA